MKYGLVFSRRFHEDQNIFFVNSIHLILTMLLNRRVLNFNKFKTRRFRDTLSQIPA